MSRKPHKKDNAQAAVERAAGKRSNDITVEKMPTRGTAACADCIFARKIVICDKGENGEPVAGREMCECHVARPNSYGFPTIRPDDFCGLHVNAETMERTFAAVSPSPVTNG